MIAIDSLISNMRERVSFILAKETAYLNNVNHEKLYLKAMIVDAENRLKAIGEKEWKQANATSVL